MKASKSAPLRVRLTEPMKDAYERMAEERGEKVAVVVREALSEYYLRHMEEPDTRTRAEQKARAEQTARAPKPKKRPA